MKEPNPPRILLYVPIISIADMIQKLVDRTKRSLWRPVDLHAPLQVKMYVCDMQHLACKEHWFYDYIMHDLWLSSYRPLLSTIQFPTMYLFAIIM